MKIKENQYRVIRIFKVLSNPIRYQILHLLSEVEDMAIVDISKKFNKDLSVISRHLSTLKKVDLVSGFLKGKYAYYKLKDKSIIKIIIELENKYKRKN